jgi:hypothetical protein
MSNGMEEYKLGFTGHRPWIMTKDQRGPTCGLTAITIAYRILTGWTIFATKGQYRNFLDEKYSVKVKKGQENAYVLRKAAKDKGFTAAGEIVNADDLAELVNLCGDVKAEVREIDGSDLSVIGVDFVKAIRKDIGDGKVPIVLCYLTDDDKPTRTGKWQHWVVVFAVEESGKWRRLKIKNLHAKRDLGLKGIPKSNQMLIWSWGDPYTIDGVSFGKASALSLDWQSTPRMWVKGKKKGVLDWDEVPQSDPKYKIVKKPKSNVRYTKVKPKRGLEKRGYVAVIPDN